MVTVRKGGEVRKEHVVVRTVPKSVAVKSRASNPAKFSVNNVGSKWIAFSGAGNNVVFSSLFRNFFGITPAKPLTGATLNATIRKLKHKDFSIRAKAARALAATKTLRVIRALENVLKTDKVWTVQAAAAEALGKIGNKKATKTLVSVFKNKNTSWYVMVKIAEAMGQIGDYKAVPALLAGLKSKKPHVFAAARDALHKIKDPKADPALVKGLMDTNKYVRGVAAAVLGTKRSKRSVPALIIALKDPEPYVLERVAGALIGMPDKRALKRLMAIAKKKYYKCTGGYCTREEYLGINIAAVRALGSIGDKRAIPVLISIMGHNDAYIEKLQKAVVQVLKKFDDPRAKKAVREYMRSQKLTRTGS